MKIYRYGVISLALLSILLNVSSAQAIGLAKIVVKVTDESGNPVSNAHLNIRFSSDLGPVKGLTDDHGIFETKAFSNDGVILGDITKDGYYEGGIAHSFFVTRFGMWQPWGKELTVVMRPIVNPVPMYVRNHFFKIPVIGEEVGFDLEKADWVVPYGLGTSADFVFRIDQRYDDGDNFDCRMTLTFSNSLDGLQVVNDDGGGDFNVGSRYRLPRTAPETGYMPKLQKRNSRGTYGRVVDMEDSNNYIFRVRSEVDHDGKLKRAVYGKIRGDIWYTPGDGGNISLHYYLNPDYTRNLEFDPKRNLFIVTSGGENVRQP